MSRFLGVKDEVVEGLGKVGSIVKSNGNSPVGGTLVFGDVIINEIFLRETRYPIFNGARKRFEKGKFAAVVNHINIGDFGLRASTTNGNGIQTNGHKAVLGSSNDVVKLIPFDDVLQMNWFESIEVKEYDNAIFQLISDKLVRDATLICLYSDTTIPQTEDNSIFANNTFNRFDGFAKQGTVVQNTDGMNSTWRGLIDNALRSLDSKAHQNPSNINIILPASRKIEIFRELVRDNIILDSQFNADGSIPYLGYTLQFDSTLDFNRVEIFNNFTLPQYDVVVTYNNSYEVIYSSDETVYVETQYGRSMEYFFGTYFAPVVIKKDLFVSGSLIVIPTP